MLWGVDVSAYQPNFDFVACRREGFDFAAIKSTEGNTWRSRYYHNQLAAARATGMLVWAYHYVIGSDVPGQLGNIRAMVSTDTPVVLDVEHGAGSLASIRQLVLELVKAGYRVPLIYIPRWYWQSSMGSADLSGLPPNWHSRYPDNVVRRKEQFVLGPEYWPTFGGLPTAVAQFTSSLAVANYPAGRIDGNAYQGTRDQLAALLNGHQEQEDDVSAEDVWRGIKIGYPGDKWTATPAEWVPSIDRHVSVMRYSDLPALRALMGQVLAAVTTNPDITEDAVRRIVDEATATAAREQAALIVEQINRGLTDLIERVRDADNLDEARKTADELLRRIGSLTTPPATT